MINETHLISCMKRRGNKVINNQLFLKYISVWQRSNFHNPNKNDSCVYGMTMSV